MLDAQEGALDSTTAQCDIRQNRLYDMPINKELLNLGNDFFLLSRIVFYIIFWA